MPTCVQLSGGMKRRVLVALALVHKPPVIVLDEPTAGVDVELRQTLWHFIAKLNKQGHTVLADHPLPGRSRGPVRPHCHAQNRPKWWRWTAPARLLKAASGNVLALQGRR